MTAVVHLTDQELAELQALTNEKDVSAAVRLAVQEFIRAAMRQQQNGVAGRTETDDNRQALEDRELDAWAARVQASADQMDPEDEVILETTLREIRQQAREVARREAESR